MSNHMGDHPAGQLYPHHRGVLRGWRAISGFLGISQSTARRWHANLKLPVARHVSRRVFTTTTLIDGWITRIDSVQREVVAEMRRDAPQK